MVTGNEFPRGERPRVCWEFLSARKFEACHHICRIDHFCLESFR